ncbi:MAG: protein kinase [Polyangiales bacterium]
MSARPGAQETIGSYVIEQPLAHGAMGHVYIARHALTYARVALKVLRDDLAADAQAEERFLREVRAAAQIGHEGIVRVHDAGRTPDGRLFLAMELLTGETLQERMERDPSQRLPIMDWILAALEPLAAAHAQGIIHRDLKPANIFIARTVESHPRHAPHAQLERIKLLDFGIARDTRQKSGTETGIALGTPHYMSPEQATRPKLVGPASDVWSVGVMMYEVLSGYMPFDGETLHAVVIQATMEPHVPLAQREPSLDHELCALVEACLTKDPRMRPADAGTLLMQLAGLLRDPRIRHELQVPLQSHGIPTMRPHTPEQMPYADTAISAIPLRLRDTPEPQHIPKTGARLGVWITLALLLLGVGGFFWLRDEEVDGVAAPPNALAGTGAGAAAPALATAGARAPDAPEKQVAKTTPVPTRPTPTAAAKRPTPTPTPTPSQPVQGPSPGPGRAGASRPQPSAAQPSAAPKVEPVPAAKPKPEPAAPTDLPAPAVNQSTVPDHEPPPVTSDMIGPGEAAPPSERGDPPSERGDPPSEPAPSDPAPSEPAPPSGDPPVDSQPPLPPPDPPEPTPHNL